MGTSDEEIEVKEVTEQISGRLPARVTFGLCPSDSSSIEILSMSQTQ